METERKSTEKQLNSEALLAIAKENKEKDSEFNVDLRLIRKELGIVIRTAGQQDHRDDVENIANYIKQRDLAILRKRANYEEKCVKYTEKRNTDPDYRKVSEVKTLGNHGSLLHTSKICFSQC
jgi:Ribonuclease G/E